MIDWFNVAMSGIWILGLGLMLSAFSYHAWLATERRRPIGELLRERSFTISWASGLFLCALGWALAHLPQFLLWEKALWSLVVAWFAWRMVAALRSRADVVAVDARLLPGRSDTARGWARRVRIWVGTATFAVVAWLLLGLPMGIDRWLDVTEAPAPADAIVCIGGGTIGGNLPDQAGWQRIYTSVQLFADGFAPMVVFTGSGSTKFSEAETYADAAAWLELPAPAVLIDPLPTRTADHPQTLLTSTKGKLTKQSRLLLVTSRAHSRRVLMTFRKQGYSNVRVVSDYEASRAEGRIARSTLKSRFAGYEANTKSYDDPFTRVMWRSTDLMGALRETAALGWYWLQGAV